VLEGESIPMKGDPMPRKREPKRAVRTSSSEGSVTRPGAAEAKALPEKSSPRSSKPGPKRSGKKGSSESSAASPGAAEAKALPGKGSPLPSKPGPKRAARKDRGRGKRQAADGAPATALGVEAGRAGPLDKSALSVTEQDVLRRLAGQPGSVPPADDSLLRNLAQRGLVRVVYQLTEEGEKALAATLGASPARARARARARAGAKTRAKAPPSGRRGVPRAMPEAAPARSFGFAIGDVVKATRDGQTTTGRVVEFNQRLGLVGVDVRMFGDVVVQWFDPEDLVLVPQG